jgi:membrane-bound lytic murein transglycosylase D
MTSCSSIQMLSGPGSFVIDSNRSSNSSEEELISRIDGLPEEVIAELNIDELDEEVHSSPDEVAIEIPTSAPNRGLFNPLAALRDRGQSQTEQPSLQQNTSESALTLDYPQEHFDHWKNYFTVRAKDRFERMMNRGENYRELIYQVMRDHGLPEELYYVALIESGFVIQARSHASAVGPWQFIRGTATRYGMRVTPAVDERTNIHKATIGAARYFQDLYNIFGSWELALAAYNAGEYRVINAIRRGGTRDFKELVEKRLLPRETIYYVPKVAAARYLSQNRRRYSLNVPAVQDTFYRTAQEVRVAGSFSLDDVSRELRLDLDTLRKLNPDIRHQVVTAPRDGHRLIIPQTHVARASNLSFQTRTVATRGAEGGNVTGSTGTYSVKRGDNLSRIAATHGTTVAEIQRLNGLKGTRILVGQTLRVPSSSGEYQVRRGDNLSRIASAHGTTVQEVRRLNNLRGNTIHPGQTLRVPAATVVVRTYTVRRGDNLSAIARRFNTTVSALQQLNQLQGSRIYPNQRLRVPGEGS